MQHHIQSYMTEKQPIKLVISKNLFLFLDIETNGLPVRKPSYDNEYYPYTDLLKYDGSRIVQICWAIYDFKKNKKVFKNYIIKPDKFKITNSVFHGITDKIGLEQGVPIKQVFSELRQDLTDVKFIVAHNIEFDINILFSELHRYKLFSDVITTLQEKEQICTGNQTRDLLKMPTKGSARYKMPKLSELYEYCFKKPMENQHNAEHDVINLVDCFFEVIAHIKI